MKDLMKQAESMMDDMIEVRKRILDKHEEDLKDLSLREANIEKEGIKVKAKALKDGFVNESIYCKYCGELIDSDSIFCKKCGKKQI